MPVCQKYACPRATSGCDGPWREGTRPRPRRARARGRAGGCGRPVGRHRLRRPADARAHRQRAELPGRPRLRPARSSCTRPPRCRAAAARSSRCGDALFAPDFANHDGSATSGLGTYTALHARQPDAGQRRGLRRQPVPGHHRRRRRARPACGSREVNSYIAGQEALPHRRAASRTAAARPSAASCTARATATSRSNDTGYGFVDANARAPAARSTPTTRPPGASSSGSRSPRARLLRGRLRRGVVDYSPAAWSRGGSSPRSPPPRCSRPRRPRTRPRGRPRRRTRSPPARRPPRRSQARQRFFGAENVDPRTGAVRRDRVILSWFGVTNFALAIRGHVRAARRLGPARRALGLRADHARGARARCRPEAIVIGHAHFDHAADAVPIAQAQRRDDRRHGRALRGDPRARGLGAAAALRRGRARGRGARARAPSSTCCAASS